MIDPTEGNLFDLPAYEHIQDETLRPLPPPGSPGGDDVDGEPEGNKLSQTKDASVATRRAVKRPVPKLDAHRLVSERGLPALRSMFENVKFRGKGHEEADLKTLIKYMEHWAHRLFPKLQFEDFVDRVERLGNKQAVQTCLKRIRLDLPILHEDFPSNEGEDEGMDEPNTVPEEFVLPSEFENAREEFGSSLSNALTEEQQQRIERNKQIALERRQAKMQLSSQSQEHGCRSQRMGFPLCHLCFCTQLSRGGGASYCKLHLACISLTLGTLALFILEQRAENHPHQRE
ncbi:TIMELESS-interacting protein isoform X2 [Tiliqua scincoides]